MHRNEKQLKQHSREQPSFLSADLQLDDNSERLDQLEVTYFESGAPIVVKKKTNGIDCICCDFSTGLNESIQTY